MKCRGRRGGGIGKQREPAYNRHRGSGKDDPPPDRFVPSIVSHVKKRTPPSWWRGTRENLQLVGASTAPGVGLEGGVNLAFSLRTEAQVWGSFMGPPVFSKANVTR